MKYLIFLTTGCLVLKTLVYCYECVPVEDCKDSDGAKVPDPTDCTKYYNCDRDVNGDYVPSYSSVQCPEYTYFDQIQGSCANAPPEGCENSCCDFCNLECSEIGNFTYPCYCSIYYKCLQIGDPPQLYRPCPENECFNSESGDCDADTSFFEIAPYCTTCPSCMFETASSEPSTTMKTDTPTMSATQTETVPTTMPIIQTDTTSIGPYCGEPCQPNFYCTIFNGDFKDCDYCAQTYWRCSGGQPTLMCCSDGYYFNTNENLPYCFAENLCPYPLPAPTETVTTAMPTTQKEPATDGPECGEPCQPNFSCTIINGDFKDCDNCAQTYWRCSEGQPTLMCCSDGYYFNTNENLPYCFAENLCPYP